jgi:outer membrane protein assembly factor BamA
MVFRYEIRWNLSYQSLSDHIVMCDFVPGFSAGGGLSARGVMEGSLSGFIGSCAYTQKNLFGLNHKLAASVEAGQVKKMIKKKTDASAFFGPGGGLQFEG